jgi:biopolymer transport protein ExbD
MSRRLQRKLRQKDPPELDITAFLNLMVVLVPFLLVSAVFSRISILELDLPAAVGEGEVNEKQLTVEVIVRGDRIEVGDGVQIVTRIMNLDPAVAGAATPAPEQPDAVTGEDPPDEAAQHLYDLSTLGKVLRQIKANYPAKLDATVLMEPSLEYNILVQVMDTVSTISLPDDKGVLQRYDLFPQISLGDAPVIGG